MAEIKARLRDLGLTLGMDPETYEGPSEAGFEALSERHQRQLAAAGF
jgi:hypothetical protein